MYIKNIKNVESIQVNLKIGKYLIKKYKIPVLSTTNSGYHFAKTQYIVDIINKLPLWVKLFYK